MKIIIERKKAHDGIISKDWKEVFDLSYERETAVQAIRDVLDELGTYHANNDTEIGVIESEYIEAIEAVKPGDYSLYTGDNTYYITIETEGTNDMEGIMDELRGRYKVDGEVNQFATYFTSKSDVLEQYDADVFEEQFDVILNDVSFPIITFDESGHDGGHLFESDADRNDILYEAERYFEKKD